MWGGCNCTCLAWRGRCPRRQSPPASFGSARMAPLGQALLGEGCSPAPSTGGTPGYGNSSHRCSERLVRDTTRANPSRKMPPLPGKPSCLPRETSGGALGRSRGQWEQLLGRALLPLPQQLEGTPARCSCLCFFLPTLPSLISTRAQALHL